MNFREYVLKIALTRSIFQPKMHQIGGLSGGEGDGRERERDGRERERDGREGKEREQRKGKEGREGREGIVSPSPATPVSKS